MVIPQGHTPAFQGVFGHDSIDTHIAWTKTPEISRVLEGVERMINQTRMHFDPVRGHEMFHVYMRENI